MNPDTLYAGFAAARIYTLPKYPSTDGWTLSARLMHGTGIVDIASINSSSHDGRTWSILIPSSTFTGIKTGKVTLQLIATASTGEACIAYSERLNFFAADATDVRGTLEKQLEAIDALLEGKASKDQSSVSYNGRSISRFTWEELQNARDSISNRIKRLNDSAAGKGRIKSVGMRFINA